MTSGQRLKLMVKLSIATVLYAVGFMQLWLRMVLRGKAVVLMYHRVLSREECGITGSHSGIVVDCEAFAAQMTILKERFRVISVEEFADRMERKVPFEDGSCLITFDDGWRDNYTHVLPILKQYGIPAVIFLPVNFIGEKRLFWQEHLTHLTLHAVSAVRRDPGRRGRFGELLAPVGLESILSVSDDDPRPVVMEAVRRQKTLPPELINATLAGVAEELGVQREEYREYDGFLNWDQVGSMARQGVAFGGHGAEHRILTCVPLSEASHEIHKAKEVLDSRLPMPVHTFSYPNGNWSPEVAKLVEEAGYRLAFTTEPGYVSCDDNRFAIRRINIHEGLIDSKPMFLARVVGLL